MKLDEAIQTVTEDINSGNIFDSIMKTTAAMEKIKSAKDDESKELYAAWVIFMKVASKLYFKK